MQELKELLEGEEAAFATAIIARPEIISGWMNEGKEIHSSTYKKIVQTLNRLNPEVDPSDIEKLFENSGQA